VLVVENDRTARGSDFADAAPDSNCVHGSIEL
jgi:hypothetical protein